ncbi:hypothetical protein [Ensifer sp. Root31]|uniref:hypothetical protein n=1 Tax=Ensifer sp. Root31 TaxID=1736512 RepID=UPI0012E7375D|nr:hypothetical protein [Ensifer sp. Root31]
MIVETIFIIKKPPRSKAEQAAEAVSVSGKRVVKIDAILGKWFEEDDGGDEEQVAEAATFLGFGAIAFSHLFVEAVLRVHGSEAPTVIVPGVHGLSPSDKL